MKKNIFMITIIFVVTVITFSVGTYAYFAINFQDERSEENKQNTTSLKTCELAEATTVSNIPDSIGSFTSTDIYPGHKEVTSFSVSANGSIGSSSSFKIIYDVKENGLNDNVKVSVYQSDEIIPTTENYFECEKKVENTGDESKYFETCKNKDLGEFIGETILTGGEETIEIGRDTLVIRNVNTDRIRYYYVVVEFLNQENQNEVMSSKLNGTIHIELTREKIKYKELILNGMDPVIKDELIPVMIENDGTVRRADEADNWYSYEEKLWANAIILKDESEFYCPGEIIEEDKIESYFVWIPKYRYQLWDLGNYSGVTNVDTTKVHTIPVIFGDYNTRDEIDGECTTPMTSGSRGNCVVGDYMTHPAFISIPSTGFWVGKFETSKGNENADNSINPSGIEIKPNEVSWRNIQVANAFYSTYDYKRNLDSHMMKNTEWGAVAYLQHSEYGSHTSVRINNNSDYLTGYAAINEPTCGYTADNRDCNQYGTTEDITLPYNTETGYLASTTGNISGIYDMSGGVWEVVMGVMRNQTGSIFSGRNSSNHSGFNGLLVEGGTVSSGLNFPDNKYYDEYLYGINLEEYTRGILGDSTCEMGPFKRIEYVKNQSQPINSWNHGYSNFVASINPWFTRSGTFFSGTSSGIFAFATIFGSSYSSVSFRVVLTPSL